jgi:hypothetical protein
MCETLWYSGLRRPNSESVRERLPLACDGGFGLLELRFQAALVVLVEIGALGDGVADVDLFCFLFAFDAIEISIG